MTWHSDAINPTLATALLIAAGTLALITLTEAIRRNQKATKLADLKGPAVWYLSAIAVAVGIPLFLISTAKLFETLLTENPGDVRWISLLFLSIVGAPFVIWRSFVAQAQADTAAQGMITDRINKAVEGLGAEKQVDRIGRPVTYWTDPGSLSFFFEEETPIELPDRTLELSREHAVGGEDLVKGYNINAHQFQSERTAIEWQGSVLDTPENEHRAQEGDWQVFSETVPNLEVRVGAVLALERIAKDSPNDHIQIMEILCAYIRENACIVNIGSDAEPNWQQRVDTQTAMTVIGCRKESAASREREATAGYKLDLRHATLQCTDMSSGRFEKAQFEGALLGKTNLEGANLQGANLRGANLQEANLRGANLHEADLWRANLQGANFWDANLQEAVLRGANLLGADLEDTNLQGANLWGANLQEANLRGAKLQGANLEEAKLQEANLEDTNLHEADLRGAKLQGANLEEAKLQEANLRGAKLQEANLEDAKLQEANLEDTNLQGANLWGAKLQEANLRGAKLQEANLEGANLQEANLWGAKLQEANLEDAKLQEANLWGANLQGADLWGAKLQGANLRGAKLQEANLEDAGLKSTDLRRCHMGHTRLRSVDFTQDTTFDRSSLDQAFGVKSGYGAVKLPDDDPPDHWHEAENSEEDSLELLQAFGNAFKEWAAANPLPKS